MGKYKDKIIEDIEKIGDRPVKLQFDLKQLQKDAIEKESHFQKQYESSAEGDQKKTFWLNVLRWRGVNKITAHWLDNGYSEYEKAPLFQKVFAEDGEVLESALMRSFGDIVIYKTYHTGKFNESDIAILDFFRESQASGRYLDQHDVSFAERFGGFGYIQLVKAEFSLEKFQQKQVEIQKTIQEWDDNLSKVKEEVETERTNLDNIKKGYNFVKLHKGFQNIYSSKQWEKRVSFIIMCFIGLSILGVMYLASDYQQSKARENTEILLSLKEAFSLKTETPIAKEIFQEDFIKASTEVSNALNSVASPLTNIWYLLPFLGGELILIYFFRIALKNFSSAKAQIVQVQLRMSLCEFIAGYTEFKKDNQQDKVSLEKFETLIFSGITMEGGDIPTTFDGIKDLAKLIKSVKD
ncbi:MAG: hypothetical protein QNL04_00280 [SAR324 cluster bacterium]|nr:hypothetical protein [SAR324 cluster bacterium]